MKYIRKYDQLLADYVIVEYPDTERTPSKVNDFFLGLGYILTALFCITLFLLFIFL